MAKFRQPRSYSLIHLFIPLFAYFSFLSLGNCFSIFCWRKKKHKGFNEFSHLFNAAHKAGKPWKHTGKNSLQYGKHKCASGTAHAPHQEKNKTVRRSERTGLAPRFLDLRIFILNSKILKFLFVCLFLETLHRWSSDMP